jgi:hypothetical protein
MSSMSYPSEDVSRASDRVAEPERRGIVAFIMSALHTSRRRQARRVMRQYEHLLTNELKQNSGEREWSLRTERHKRD